MKKKLGIYKINTIWYLQTNNIPMAEFGEENRGKQKIHYNSNSLCIVYSEH